MEVGYSIFLFWNSANTTICSTRYHGYNSYFITNCSFFENGSHPSTIATIELFENSFVRIIREYLALSALLFENSMRNNVSISDDRRNNHAAIVVIDRR